MASSRAALLVMLLMVAPPAIAQEAPKPQTPSPAESTVETTPEIEEVQALIERMQEKIRKMNETAAERDRALQFLEKQVEEAAALIGTTSQTAQSMKERAAALQSQLQDLSRARDALSGAVSEREQLLAALEQRVATLAALLGLERPDRNALGESLEALKTRLEQTLLEREALKEALAESQQVRASLEEQLVALDHALNSERQRRAAEVASLEERIEQERQAKAQEVAALSQALGERDKQIFDLQQAVKQERTRAQDLEMQVERLTLQVRRFQELVASTEVALSDYHANSQKQLQRIAELESQLAEALARKVEELQQYRSEFFGRLKQALADRPDIKIVGDRFVLPAELLFPSGSAELEPEGRSELKKVAQTLKEVSVKIPSDIDWVLRVEGHTDRRPLRPESPYRSNWELSLARALRVVEYLIELGIPPERLMAAGLGEFWPADPGESEEAYRRNRRIEFKLTER